MNKQYVSQQASKKQNTKREVRTAGEVIFRQGDEGREMYDIVSGEIGIYLNYGTDQEKLLTKLHEEDYFGEMALIDETVRSATAVALEKNTQLNVITQEDFASYFETRPNKLIHIMQHLSSRLRGLTKDYLNACQTVTEAAASLEEGKEVDEDLARRVRYFAAQAKEI